MTTRTVTDVLTLDTVDPMGSAREYVAQHALNDDARGRVGLELELHLVDLGEPACRPAWATVQRALSTLPPMPFGSVVTLEPGGQIELSTIPHDDVVAAVAALRMDTEVLRRELALDGLGAAALGADPAREVRRINPHPRYAAMEDHFEALGCARSGRAMMASTAALQINLDAGPAPHWADRLEHIRALGPVLVAASSTSPYLGGRSSGWHSMRQETWHGIDHPRSQPFSGGEPTEAWAEYALAAPVMIRRDGDALTPVTARVPFEAWLRNPALLGRAAQVEDLDYHLTTLFPPFRPRGYIEIRCLDALPDAWWPAVAAIAVTLIDDPVAADAAAELCEPVAERWESAARRGPDDPAVDSALRGCVDVAARRCAGALRSEVEAFAELILAGRSPSREIRQRIETEGPMRVLEEEAHA